MKRTHITEEIKDKKDDHDRKYSSKNKSGRGKYAVDKVRNTTNNIRDDITK